MKKERIEPCPTCGQPRKVIDGAMLKARRLALGLGVRQVARTLKVDPGFITRVEQGRYREAPKTREYIALVQP